MLLAIGGTFDFLYLAGFFVSFVLAITGANFIGLFPCFFVQFLSVFGLFSSVWIVFFIGLDRLFGIAAPLW